MKLNRREVTVLISGLVVGLLLGMVMVSLDEDLALFGTAGGEGKNAENKGDKGDVLYYRVPLEDAQTWLMTTYPELSEEKQQEWGEAFAKISALPTSADFFTQADVMRDDIANNTSGNVLDDFYAALTGVEADKLDEVSQLEINEGVTTCLGLYDSPVPDELGMYVYLKLSDDEAKKLELPKEWEDLKLQKPAENDILWLDMGCYPDVESAS
jgi:hypothetical protein